MSRKPYARDWQEISPGVEYSTEQNIYWANGRAYDERSARHNGIIGKGAQLRHLIKEGLQNGKSE